MFLFTAVEAVSKEVLVNTETVISCKITQINEQMSIEWSGFTQGSNFDPKQGSYDPKSNSQTGTLTVKSSLVSEDKIYTCTVSSIQYPLSSKKIIDVSLDIYCKFFNLPSIVITFYFSFNLQSCSMNICMPAYVYFYGNMKLFQHLRAQEKKYFVVQSSRSHALFRKQTLSHLFHGRAKRRLQQ